MDVFFHENDFFLKSMKYLSTVFIDSFWADMAFRSSKFNFNQSLIFWKLATKEHDLSKKNFSISHAPLWDGICHVYSLSLKARKLKCWFPKFFKANLYTSYSELWNILRVPPIHISAKKSTHSLAVLLCVARKPRMTKRHAHLFCIRFFVLLFAY
jgi:hypothetical protein